MEKKYYFRGLGLGIIVTAVIMGIALSGDGEKGKMTDDEVIARAKELGMIEDSTLLEAAGVEDAEDGPDTEETPSVQREDAVKKDIAVAKEKEEADKKAEEQEPEPVPDVEKPVVGTPESLEDKENRAANGGETEADMGKKPSSDTNEMTKPDEDGAKPETKPTTEAAKSVTIAGGDSSYTVAKKLADVGAVGSAEAYDDFLCANGYDKKLRPGTFKIPSNASDEQIARIVTGQ